MDPAFFKPRERLSLEPAPAPVVGLIVSDVPTLSCHWPTGDGRLRALLFRPDRETLILSRRKSSCNPD